MCNVTRDGHIDEIVVCNVADGRHAIRLLCRMLRWWTHEMVVFCSWWTHSEIVMCNGADGGDTMELCAVLQMVDAEIVVCNAADGGHTMRLLLAKLQE